MKGLIENKTALIIIAVCLIVIVGSLSYIFGMRTQIPAATIDSQPKSGAMLVSAQISDIEGKYVKAKSEIVQQIEGKLDISCELTTKMGDTKHIWFIGRVKNISGTTLSLSKKGEKNDALDLKITMFDQSGKGWGAVWPHINLRNAGNGLTMAPNESINYEAGVDNADAARITRYEIQLYYWTPSFEQYMN
jgi:hypothetical protein